VPVKEIRRSSQNGGRKVNIETDIRLAMTGAMRQTFAKECSASDPRKALLEAKKAARGVCRERFDALGSAGQRGAGRQDESGAARRDGRALCLGR
jgi:fructose-bisphosphate aldolase class II